ncbi:hypothetical protein MNV49_000163 [Pseudohyphozyma bogoriensis]|nr:hypothetical protein MNV49_000163 [Pseudohyphozyma bogoriensis]
MNGHTNGVNGVNGAGGVKAAPEVKVGSFIPPLARSRRSSSPSTCVQLDKTYGPEPNKVAKFRVASTFVKFYRAYQWTVGTCTFQITAQQTTFTEGQLAGQQGYFITDPYRPTHSHSPPYHPLSLTTENARRKHLLSTDPSLETPPLTPVSRFVDLLQSINPSLVAYLPQLRQLGLADVTPEELRMVDDDTIRESLMEAKDIPPFARLEIAEGLKWARRRGSNNGAIGEQGAREKARKWCEDRLREAGLEAA